LPGIAARRRHRLVLRPGDGPHRAATPRRDGRLDSVPPAIDLPPANDDSSDHHLRGVKYRLNRPRIRCQRLVPRARHRFGRRPRRAAEAWKECCGSGQGSRRRGFRLGELARGRPKEALPFRYRCLSPETMSPAGSQFRFFDGSEAKSFRPTMLTCVVGTNRSTGPRTALAESREVGGTAWQIWLVFGIGSRQRPHHGSRPRV